jgi:predicted acylesterase/phospholipase RssA
MEAIITAIVGVIGGSAFGAFVAGLFAKKKTSAEINRLTSDAWKEFALKMETRQTELDNELTETRKELKATNRRLDRYGDRIIYLTKGNKILVNQLLVGGITPKWVPSEWDPDGED